MIKIYKKGETEAFLRQVDKTKREITDSVEQIIKNVEENGDRALREYSLKFDKAELGEIEVSRAEIDAAFASVEPRFIEVLEKAAENIRSFHSKQVRNGFIISEKDGQLLGQKIIPIEKVGIYIPGGTAPLPSSVLMNCIPAKLAGCAQIVMVSPPTFGGTINPVILAAAKIAGVDKVYKIGGAQAIAALACGTETVVKVDKIVGPGNAFVAEAKRQVYGRVSIDMIAGPSDILVVADGKSDPIFVAADLLSQAEHDKMATAVLVTDSAELAEKVADEIERQLELLPRKDIARASIENNGKIILVDNIKEAIEMANELAPEHLEICVDSPFDYLDSVKNAGSVFLGRYCPEAVGDYFAGPNHTLPTNSTARFSSPVSVDDFIKKTQFTYFTKEALAKVADDIVYFAEKEQLHAHGESVAVRFRESK